MLDHEGLIYRMLRTGAPELEFIPTLDVTTVERVPLVLFSLDVQNAIPGTPSPPFAWDANLSLTPIGGSLDEAWQMAARLYDLVWSWDDPFTPGQGHIVPGVGSVANISDQALFSRTGTVDLPSLHQTQYDGTFGLQIYRA